MAGVVVVEDEQDIRDLMVTRLRGAGHEVRAADTAAAGLALIGAHRPDVVLLDVDLPDATGLEVCHEIRAQAALRGVLVVMVSAAGAQHQVDAGLAAGADDYITKPFSPGNLLARVGALLLLRTDPGGRP